MNHLRQPWDEPIKACKTIEEMRAEIHRQRRNDPNIHQAMSAAEYQGLSAEDTYTLLAFGLLNAVRPLQRALHEAVLTNYPQPMFITPRNGGQP